MSPTSQATLQARAIVDADLTGVAALLTKGFPRRGRAYWVNALSVLKAHASPEGYPRYGYVLEDAGRPVGVVLLIFTAYRDGETDIRCNVSSWYVEPRYRTFAAFISAPARNLPGVAYINTSPAENTWPIIEALGYHRYNSSQFVCIPALSTPRSHDRVEAYNPNLHAAAVIDPQERGMLLDHLNFGHRVIVCQDGDGLYPFVFLLKSIRYFPLPVLQLAYCRDTAEFIRFAGVIGRYFLCRGRFIVILDADAPVSELKGRYFQNRSPKYFKGPAAPRLNDLAYTEAALFGP